MLDCAALETAVQRLADRFRSLPASRLRGVPAQAGLALARELAAQAQRLEFPDRAPAVLPDHGVFVIGDQLSVAGHDLALALAAHPEAGEVLRQALRAVSDTSARSGL